MIGDFESGHLYFSAEYDQYGDKQYRELYINCFCGDGDNVRSADLDKLSSYCEMFWKRFSCPNCNMDLMYVCDYSDKDPHRIVLVQCEDQNSWMEAILRYPKIINVIPEEFRSSEFLLAAKLL
jgi:hypothetical protein